jgi:hypothetical protein
MSMQQRRTILGLLLGVTLLPQAGAAQKVSIQMDEKLDLPADAMARLEDLRRAQKFVPEVDGLYTGVHDASERLAAEATVNAVIERVEQLASGAPTKKAVLGEFSLGLSKITLSDTEDREQAALYMERIMDCVGMESSDGLLNTWMYGFDPT